MSKLSSFHCLSLGEKQDKRRWEILDVRRSGCFKPSDSRLEGCEAVIWIHDVHTCHKMIQVLHRLCVETLKTLSATSQSQHTHTFGVLSCD